MATGLQAQTLAAADSGFQQKVRDAMITAAISIYNEATVLSANIKSGTASASLPVTPALSAAIPAGTVVRVGSELFVCAAGAASGAASIATTTTSSIDHFQGQAVSPPAINGHDVRASYARVVLGSPDSYAPAFCAALASQGLDASSTDAAISNGVSSVWNALAGA